MACRRICLNFAAYDKEKGDREMAADITDIPNIVRAVRAAWPVGDEALAA